jgi:hypothetical protein
MESLRSRLAGEWLAFWWCALFVPKMLKGLLWSERRKLINLWRHVHPFRKCNRCASWQQAQVIAAQQGLCCSRNSELNQMADEACGNRDDNLEEDVPF